MNNQRDHFSEAARENSVTQTNSAHVGLGRRRNRHVQSRRRECAAAGSNLNITLTPLDFSSRSRSLHNVLTSISGEMARLAVSRRGWNSFDPLSSAKAILWLGDERISATPQDFKGEIKLAGVWTDVTPDRVSGVHSTHVRR